MLVDNVAYHIAMHGTLCITPPFKDRKGLIQEAHGGKLAGQQQDAKIFGQLSRARDEERSLSAMPTHVRPAHHVMLENQSSLT